MLVRKIKVTLFILNISVILFITSSSIFSQGLNDVSHLDKKNLLKGCGSCHKGHGIYNTPMLPEQRDKFCFRCHGYPDIRSEMKNFGYLANDIDLKNIEKEFEKTYHHPIEILGIHEYGETLPERDPSMPRHSVCADCHHHHYVKKSNKHFGISGVNNQEVIVQEINSEYELCFKCHSYSANLPSDQTNKAEMFNVSNPSYHPVIVPGKNADVPSLINPLTATSTIKCIDCHNNNDSSGPNGPHGSEYPYILSRNYNQNDGPEGVFEYELCYHCHSRDSILSNGSFFYHSLHVSVNNTSCRTCHNPHGSTRFNHLIDLDNTSIRPSSSGNLDFNDFGNRTGQCFLTCHGKDHNPALYPGQT